MASIILRDAAKKALPLVAALAEGKDLEFIHNDGEWRIYRGVNLIEVEMSPHRFRVSGSDS